MADIPKLPIESLARIELAKLDASRRLQHVLQLIRSEPNEDKQVELCIAYAEYIRVVYFAKLGEFLTEELDRSTLPSICNRIAQETTLEILPKWKNSGGLPEWKDYFVEAAFKLTKASPQNEEFLKRLSAQEHSPAPDFTSRVGPKPTEPVLEVPATQCSVLEPRLGDTRVERGALTGLENCPLPILTDELQNEIALANSKEKFPSTGVGPTNTTSRRRPGPKPNVEVARRVVEIVKDVAGLHLWKDKLDDICDALNEAKIPCPKTWRRRDPAIRNWTDAAATEYVLALKAIEHHLELALI